MLSELRYKAWGETRYSSGTTPSKYRYTGQREEASLGLYFYNARWFDPVLGRFTSADSIVPAGVQGYDRYAFVYNNPLKYIDPSGHNPNPCSGAVSGYKCHREIDRARAEERALCGNGVQYCDVQSSNLSVVPNGKYDQYIDLEAGKMNPFALIAILIINGIQYLRTNAGLLPVGHVTTGVGYDTYINPGDPLAVRPRGVELKNFVFYNDSPDSINSIKISLGVSQNGVPIGSASRTIAVEVPSHSALNVQLDPSKNKIPSNQNLEITITFDIQIVDASGDPTLTGTTTHTLIP
jgi:RHS repeat-associated protein